MPLDRKCCSGTTACHQSSSRVLLIARDRMFVLTEETPMCELSPYLVVALQRSSCRGMNTAKWRPTNSLRSRRSSRQRGMFRRTHAIASLDLVRLERFCRSCRRSRLCYRSSLGVFLLQSTHAAHRGTARTQCSGSLPTLHRVRPRRLQWW